ncbi:PQQ-binding-like beta-propeller repeat protein [Rhodococcus kronopolitis]|uniref:PQQ-binding-like beta-propeller repeat protein n=1 Tax=Rhodococcus kronopolitis TaxID=1460226 RepID=A0ABV9FK46_9NOCA
MRRVLRSTAVSLTAVAALALAACGGGAPVQDVFSAGGWPGAHADARSSNTSPADGPRTPSFAWSRPLLAPTTSGPSVSAGGQVFVTTRAEHGCNLYSFELDSGRKRWCNRLAPAVAAATPVVDRATNIYVGEDGAMNSFTELGQLRWRTIVSGTPLSAQFTGDGNLLFVTQFGVVSVLNPQNGREVVPSHQLIPAPTAAEGQNLPLPPADLGLDQCAFGGPECPVPAGPAIDLASGNFYLTLRLPDRDRASVVAMRYADGALTGLWSADVLDGGTSASPSLSADGTTVYAGDNKGTLWALDAATGQLRWSRPLGYPAAGTPSVSSDGLIIPAPGQGGHLLALRDRGDHAEVAWERRDLAPVGGPAQAGGAVGYTEVREGPDASAPTSLLTFDTGTGETLDQDTLPGGGGPTTGTAIGPDGEVLTATALGELFVLR